MRSLLWIVLSGCLLLQVTGCCSSSGETNDNDGGTTNSNDAGLPTWSAINIYNCSATEQIQVYKQTVGASSWTTLPEYYRGSHAGNNCHATDNLAIYLSFDNGSYTLKLKHKGANDSCALTPENLTPNTVLCPDEPIGSYSGNATAPIATFDFHQ